MADIVEQNSPTQPAPPEPVSYNRNESPIWNLFGKVKTLLSNRTTAVAAVLVLVLGVGAGIIAVQRSTEYRQRAAEPSEQVNTLSANIINGDTSSKPSQPVSSGKSISWIHTIGSAGSNRMLIVGVVLKGSGFSSGLPITEVAATFVTSTTKISLTKYTEKISSDGTLGLAVYYLKNPDSGNYNIAISTSVNVAMSAGSTSWYGVNQTTPLSTPVTQLSPATASTENPYLSTEAQQDAVFFDLVGIDITAQSCLFSPNSSQSLQWSFNTTGAGAGSSFQYSPSSGSLIGSWGIPSECSSGGNIKKWVYMIGKLLPAGGSLVPVLSPSSPIPCGNFGDVDGDHQITPNDADEIDQHRNGRPPIVRYIAANADVNGDGNVNDQDETAIANYIENQKVPGTNFVTLPACLSSPYKINGTVYIDANSNQKFDTDEQPYTGGLARLAVNGQAVGVDSSGNYFYNVSASNTFQVFLYVPSGYTATTNIDVKGVTVPPSRRIDFGIKTAGALPECDSGEQCSSCASPMDVCDGSGTRTCTLTQYSGGGQCTQIPLEEDCSGAPPNCSSGFVCSADAECVPGATATLAPTGAPVTGTRIALTVGLDGIGNTGDNVNRTDTSAGNKSPQDTYRTRSLFVELYNSSETLVSTHQGELVYDDEIDLYKATVGLGNTPTGNNISYIVKLRVPGYLKRELPGFLTFSQGQEYTVVHTVLTGPNLIAGDLNNDNELSIADWNIINACTFNRNPTVCGEFRSQADYTANGVVDDFDYALFLREFSLQTGD